MPLGEGQSAEDAAAQEIDGLTFKFVSNAMTYWKSTEMDDLDKHFGDLHSAIEDRQIEILDEMHQEVLQHQQSIVRASAAMARLDALLSLARAAQEYAYVRPTMTTDNVIRITQGRHPLSERCMESFVPNDTALRGGSKNDDERNEHSMIVVTGPNASGKSIYIKSIALTVLMAQCGSFVPAATAEIGICDKIVTSIQVTETVSKLQSNFMIDISQVALALRQATARSLILLDETARGTDAIDGAALFASIIADLLHRKEAAPKVAVATHFHEVFFNGLLAPGLAFEPKHMQIVFDQAGDEEELVFLFRAVPGFAEASYAGFCAELFGIEPELVERGRYITNLSLAGRTAKLAFEGLEDEEEEDAAAPSEAGTGVTKPVPGRCVADKASLLRLEGVVRRFFDWDLAAAVDEAEMLEEQEDSEQKQVIREGLRRILQAD